jgi:hypothetical protein
MKRVKLLFVALFVATIALTSCGKYEEGPSISLRSKKARITGEWKMVKQMYNGTEVALSAEEKNVVLDIQKDGKFLVKTTGFSFEGTWEFSSDKKKFITKQTFGGQTSTDESTILRLTNKELILEDIDSDGDKSRTELEKQ